MENWLTREEAERLIAEGGVIRHFKSFGRGPWPWISLGGSVASIISMWFGFFPNWVGLILVSFFTAIIAVGFWHFRSRKDLAEKMLFDHLGDTDKLVSSFTYVHQLIHDTRDFFLLTNFQAARGSIEKYEIFLGASDNKVDQ